MFTVYSIDHDKVINAAVGIGKTTYNIALNKLYPQINQLISQRKLQDAKFYERLKRDILNGCVMPPITIAFIIEDDLNLNDFTAETLGKYLETNIHSSFILDGIQRLNTLKRAFEQSPDIFPVEAPIFFSVLVCKTMDSLLYRMITLNNGQKPMTTRHQIEIVASNLYDFSDSSLAIETEKEGLRKKGVFKKADFILAYQAFLTNSTAIDSQKLIEDKLEELIAFKILETNPLETSIQFSEVLAFIEKITTNDYIRNWFKNSNNLVGFTSSIKASFDVLKDLPLDSLITTLQNFELALDSFNLSKIKLGQIRRNAVNKLISNFQEFNSMNHLEMMEKLAKHL